MYKIATTNMSGREPYPFPRLENDTNFVGRSPEKSSTASCKLSGSTGDKWTKLSTTKTLSSSRQEAGSHDPQAPLDSLDFVLKSRYNHSEEFKRSKAETLFQSETAGVPDHGRVLKNRPVVPKPVTLEEVKLKTYSPKRKITTNSSKSLAIECTHSEATNRGYSRKDDGGFYPI